MSRKNIKLLKDAGYKFTLGGRIKKESGDIADWIISPDQTEDRLNAKAINGDERLIVSYSSKRTVKDARNREKGVRPLQLSYHS